MIKNNEEEISQLKSKMIKMQLILGIPGLLLIGLGMHSYFLSSKGEALHPLLNNIEVAKLLLVAGGAIAAAHFILHMLIMLKVKKLSARHEGIST